MYLNNLFQLQKLIILGISNEGKSPDPMAQAAQAQFE